MLQKEIKLAMELISVYSREEDYTVYPPNTTAMSSCCTYVVYDYRAARKLTIFFYFLLFACFSKKICYANLFWPTSILAYSPSCKVFCRKAFCSDRMGCVSIWW